MKKQQKHFLIAILAGVLLYFREYPKVCVNLQTDVR